MDEFGVLTERYGLRPQGKSAPMAAAKRAPHQPHPQTTTASSFGQSRTWASNSFPYSHSKVLDDDYDLRFESKNNNFDYNLRGNDDVFGDFIQQTAKQAHTNGNGGGNAFDYDSVFTSSSSSKKNLYDDDDLFGYKKSSNSNSVDNDDLFGSFKQKGSPQVDDLFGGFGGSNFKSSGRNGSVKSGFDDLLPGFSSSTNGHKAETTTSSFTSAQDPFIVLESTSTSVNTSYSDPLEEISKLSGSKKPGSTPTIRPPSIPAQVSKADKGKSSNVSAIDELEDFAMGKVRNNARQGTKAARYKEAEDAPVEPQHKGEVDLETFFSASPRASSVPRSRRTVDSIFDEKIQNKRIPPVVNNPSSGPSPAAKKTSPATNVDDLSSIFGGASVFGEFGEFEEVENESEERRKARMGRYQRTNNRMAQALADMNQRERQNQHEQEERRRISESIDIEIKRWATGKEGNMRALLSSLQQVLWPECGWDPVSLTDLITSTSVKKVYRKATLYVHPDKVQQKGATLQQKYIAEKVFDILKEAWNKFDAEELRKQ